MKDGTRELTNNQWLLKADADKLPATYAELVTLLTGAGLPFGRTLLSDGWTIEPDPLNKANLLKDVTAGLYGLTSTAMVDDALKLAAPKMLLQSYTTAGTYTWTAPDRNGDGSDYEISVVIVGGGGSGGASKRWHTTEYWALASGGGSGYLKYIKITVTPGQTYTVVVGVGGLSVSTLNTTNSSVAGNNGGSSSFNGNVSEGGKGGAAFSGTAGAADISGADGGQASDAPIASYKDAVMYRPKAPYGGQTPIGMVVTSYDIVYAPETHPEMCMNPITGMLLLGAGGSCFGQTNLDYSLHVQSADIIFEDGGKAGASKNYYNNANDQIGVDATSVGCGGGAIVHLGSTTTNTNIATSGKGADGAILIYA